jgi:hypothetical protein
MRGGGVAGSQPMSTAVHAHGAQINFGDLTLFLTKESISVPFSHAGGEAQATLGPYTQASGAYR